MVSSKLEFTVKVALLAPIEERVPPRRYGGTEVVAYTLAEELTRLGHDVTLFASGDSKISGRLVPLVPKAIGSGHSKRLREAQTYCALAGAIDQLRREKFDIIHNHIGWQALLFKDLIKTPFLTTLHFVLDNPVEACMYKRFKNLPFVSISNNQRRTLPNLRYAKTIYHGLDLTPFRFNPKPGEYLAFLGRFSWFKGPLEAIKIAKKTGHQLIMAGKINDFERDFYDQKIAPHIDGQQIISIGEVNMRQKVTLLTGAKALLNPIQWQEPFGLTNIEAMACGTPVIATRIGSMPEIIEDGKTGFLCKNVNEMSTRVKQISTISREACRQHVERRFTAERMAKQYLSLYERLQKR